MRTTRSSLWLALYALLVVAVLPNYFASTAFPIPEFGAKVYSFGVFTLLCLALFCVGFFLLRSPISLLNALFSFWLGLGALGSVVLLLGWIFPGSLSIKLTAVSILLFGTLLFFLHRHGRILKGPFSITSEWTVSSIFMTCVSFAAIFTVFIGCFSPVTYYDSLVYHLALPSTYNHMGKISDVPFNLYSYFPANVEMVFLYILNQFANPEYIINLLEWGVSLSLCAGVAEWAYALGGRRQAVLAVFLWWTMPAALFLSVGGYIELPLAGFIFFSIRSFVIAKDKNWNTKWLILGGIFSGFAMATKYTGAICPILLCAYLMGNGILRREKFLMPCLFFGFAAALPILPWLIKNGIYVGNPFFPFFYKTFGTHQGWTTQTAAGYFEVLTEYDHKSQLLFEIFRAPWSFTSGTLRYGGGFDVLGDFGWPLLLFATPLAFFLRKNKTLSFLSFYAFGHFVFWYASKPVLRFLIGMLPVAVLLSSAAIEHLTKSINQKTRALTLLLASPWLISNFFLFWFINQTLQPFSVSLGIESRGDYLRRRLTFYSTFEVANDTLEHTDKALLIGEQRTFHLRIPFESSNYFALSPVAAASNEAKSENDIAQYCLQHKLTHVLINELEIQRLGGWGKFGFTPEGQRHFGNFVAKRANLVFENRGVKLYRITN